MKKILFLVVVVITGTLFCSQEELFLQANQKYEEKNFAQAFELYQSINPKSHAIWYNMGNCAYKMNEHKAALLYWNNAEHTATAAQHLRDIEHNRMILAHKDENLFSSKEDRLFPFPYFKIIPLSFLQLLFLSVWFTVWLLMRRRKKWILGAMVFFNGICGIMLLAKHRDVTLQRAIVMKSDVAVFAGPDENFPHKETLEPLTEFVIDEVKDHWCKVRTKKLVGWIPMDSCVRV